MKDHIFNAKGFISWAVSVGLAVLSLFATSNQSVVNESSTERADATSRARASLYATAGLEKAVWDIDQGIDPTGVHTFDQGTVTITINGNQLTAVGRSDISQVVQQIQTPTAGGGGGDGTAPGGGSEGGGTGGAEDGGGTGDNAGTGGDTGTGGDSGGGASTADSGGTSTGGEGGTTGGSTGGEGGSSGGSGGDGTLAGGEGGGSGEGAEGGSEPTDATKGCLAIDCSHIVSAGPNLTTIKFRKDCLTAPTLSRLKVDFSPDFGEKIVEVRIQGTQVYADGMGVNSGGWMDIEDYSFRDNAAPVVPTNYIKFADHIPGGKTYVLTAEFTDRSSAQATCVDGTPSAACGNGACEVGESSSKCPADCAEGVAGKSPVNFAYNGDGTLTIPPACETELKVLGTDISYGSGGPSVDVALNRALNADYPANYLFNEAPVRGGEAYQEVASLTDPKKLKIKAKSSLGTYGQVYETTNVLQVKTLVDKSRLPQTWSGFGGSQPVSAFVSPYVDPGTGTARLEGNQALLLFELGVDTQSFPDSTSMDYQDLVVLVTVKNCP